MPGDPSNIMTGDHLADTIRTVTGAMRGASALQLAALDRLTAHVRATEALTAAHRPSAVELRVARDSASAARVDAEIAYRRASRDHADAAERALRGAVDREARANEALAAEEARAGLTQRER